jgi:hypothetical protein
MPARRVSLEVCCPSCDHRFLLDGPITEHLKPECREHENAALRSETRAGGRAEG